MSDLQIYIAGTFTFGVGEGQLQYNKLLDHEKQIVHQVVNRLESWHYVGKEKKVRELRAAGTQVFLDSGAYSAYTLGVELNVEDYCRYIKENEDLIRKENGILLASVLDGIGDPLKTYQNQVQMESLGVRPLPCFHAGEDERYLEHYIANYEYITLGGMVGSSQKQLELWLDRMFEKYILDGSGRPKTRVHGFGITAVPLMERYPWYSCDSSSWIQSTAFGSITIPGYGNLDISDESPSRQTAGKHIDTLTPIEQQRIVDILKEQGFDLELVRRYLGRVTYNLWSYQEIERMINEKKRAGMRQPLTRELF
jgi:hypothetical protein